MFTSIEPELNQVLAQLERDCTLPSGGLWKLVPHVKLNSIDISLRPALVLLSGKLCRGSAHRMIILAGVVQLIFLAQEIHNSVSDDCPQEDHQFPVLTGDYLFSRFYQRLTDYNLLEWLAPLSSVICEMNEGGLAHGKVSRESSVPQKKYRETLRQEHGRLTALACKMGGVVAGADPRIVEFLEQYGLNLGMAWGIVKGKWALPPGKFLSLAQESLAGVPSGPERDSMGLIVEGIRGMAK